MTASVFRKISRLLSLRSGAAPARRRPGPALLWLLATVLLAAPFTASAQLNLNGRSYDVQGDVAMIGNQLLQCSSDQSNACHGNNGSNTNVNMVWVNVDPVGAPAPANSSTADLTVGMMPSGATIKTAWLYWAGRSGNSNANRGVIWLKIPGGGYTQITASELNTFTTVANTDNTSRPYTAKADVTALVQAGGSGTYAVGGLTANSGNGGSLGNYGGWAIIVLYEHNSKPLRRLMLWDGNAGYLGSSGTVAQTVSGILTPPSGNFNAYMGALVWEGDAGLTGDNFSLTGAGVLDGGVLSDTASPNNNFWNSRVSNLGVLNTARNPAHANNYAIDLKLVDISNIPANAGKPRISNSATTATLTFGTSADNYFPHALVFVSDLFRPSVLPSLTKTVANVSRPGAPDVMPGEILEYTIKFGNSGQDGAIRVVVTDPIPTGTTYVPNSLSVHRDDGLGIGSATPRSDASGDDQGEFNGSQVVFRVGSGSDAVNGGMLAQNQQAELRFRVTVNPDFLGPTLTNVVSLTHGSQTFPNDPDQTVTGNTNSTIPLLIPPVRVTKTSTPSSGSTVNADDEITYTLTAEVTDVALATALVLTDTLTAGQMFGAVMPGSSFSANVGGAPVLVFTLPAGTVPGTYSVSYITRVEANASGSIGNTVVASGQVPAPLCTSCTTTHPLADPAISIFKLSAPADGSDVAPGDTVTYTLMATITQAALTSPLVLTDTLGTGLTFGSVTAPGSYTPDTSAAPVLTFTLPVGTPPGAYAVEYTATVAAGATGSVGNSVVPTGGSPTAPTCADCTTTHTVKADPDLAVVKTGPAAATYGVPYDYTITVTNSGGAATTAAATVTDVISDDLGINSVSPGCVVSAPPAPFVVTCTVPAGLSNVAPNNTA
ncbi:MAG: DUF11 domain-containing protein, partial [Thermomonas sp.]|nr:DUF11 domain-containing protein [Thermomonas sp.]